MHTGRELLTQESDRAKMPMNTLKTETDSPRNLNEINNDDKMNGINHQDVELVIRKKNGNVRDDNDRQELPPSQTWKPWREDFVDNMDNENYLNNSKRFGIATRNPIIIKKIKDSYKKDFEAH